MDDIAFIIRKKSNQEIMGVVHGTRRSGDSPKDIENHHRSVIRQWLRCEKQQDPMDIEFIYSVEERPLYHWKDWPQFA